MVGQRLQGYLESCGLEAEDVPKVAGAFLTAKYLTWGASIALALRFHPLRRVFLSRQEALFGRGVARLWPWAQRKHLWLVQALDAERRRGDSQVGKSVRSIIQSRQVFGNRVAESAFPVAGVRKKTSDLISHPADRNTRGLKLVSKLQSRFKGAFARAFQACHLRFNRAKASYKEAKSRWHSAGFQLLSRPERSRSSGLAHAKSVRLTWYAWASAKYWQLSDKLADAAGSSWAGRFLSQRFSLDPKGLALGLAEGTILFKFTIPLHTPLMLLTVIHFFKQRRYVAAETLIGESLDASAMTSTSPRQVQQKFMDVLEAALDAEE